MAQRRKWALLVGCNYPNTSDHKLQGCYNDVQNMKDTLTSRRFGFNLDDIKILTDDPNELVKPTSENIRRELNAMVGSAQGDDLIFFYFSGHGSKVRTYGSGTIGACIFASDSNIITGADLKAIMEPLLEKVEKKEVTFIIMADSDCSGGLIDKEPGDQVIFFGGCGIEEKRVESWSSNLHVGAFSNAVQSSLHGQRSPLPNISVIEEVKASLKRHPYLCCSSENENVPFLLQGIKRGTGRP